MPRLVSSWITAGSLKIACTSRLSSAITSGGVAPGATSICHDADSKPGTVSATVGMSGAAGLRLAVVTATPRTIPCWIIGRVDVVSPNSTWMWPAIRSFIAGGVALYGTWVIWMPARLCSSSVLR